MVPELRNSQFPQRLVTWIMLSAWSELMLDAGFVSVNSITAYISSFSEMLAKVVNPAVSSGESA